MYIERFAVTNLILGAWLLTDAVQYLRLATPTVAGAMDVVMAAVLAFLGICVLLRKAPSVSISGIGTWAVVLLGSFIPILYFWLPLPVDFDSFWAVMIRLVGTAGFAVSAFQLGRNFSLLPQLRQVVSTGIYSLVRHPMYASYLIIDISYWLPGGSLTAGVVWITQAFFLLWRARIEEKCMKSASYEYTAYCEQVRHRFIPGLF